MSFAFMNVPDGNKYSATELMKDLSPHIRFMMDSGAFSNYHNAVRAAKKGRKYELITLDDYMKACHFVKEHAWGYIVLDVIGNPKATKDNYNAMLSNGLKPIPVLTFNEGFDQLQKYAKDTDKVCFGGIVGAKKQYINTRFIQARGIVGNSVKIHALGYCPYPELLGLKYNSGDSSSYCSGGRFGSLAWFYPGVGVKTIGWQKVVTASSRDAIKMLHRLFDMGLTKTDLANSNLYSKVHGIPAMTTVYAHIRMQRQLAKNGFHYYFAVPNISWLTPIFGILGHENENGNGFNYFRAKDLKLELDTIWKENPESLIDVLKTILEGNPNERS